MGTTDITAGRAYSEGERGLSIKSRYELQSVSHICEMGIVVATEKVPRDASCLHATLTLPLLGMGKLELQKATTSAWPLQEY